MSEKPLAEIYDDIASAIRNQKTRSFHWTKSWPHKFHIVQMAPGARIIVQEHDDQEISEIPIEHVTNCIMRWLHTMGDPETLLTPRQAKEAAGTWLGTADPIMATDVHSISWKTVPGFTWRRLPWEMAGGPTPTWDKIFSKLTNPDAFRRWLGSLMFEDARQHQYVWVHGMGNDGKGSINRFLKSVFGRSYRSKQPPNQGDKFWTYGLIGSRLVVFPDCNSQGFTTGGLFKTLSGGDPVDVEAKGRMSFTTTLNCKFLFFSNEKPNISCEDADMRRIIYCEFFEKTQKEDADPEFEQKLWAEGGAFLTRCVKEYEAACPNHQPIESGKEEIQDWVSVNDEEFQAIFDANFVLVKDREMHTHKALAALELSDFNALTIKPESMLGIVQDRLKDKREQKLFRDWLYKKFGVQKRGIKRPEGTVYRYIGIRSALIAKSVEKANRSLKVVTTPSTVDGLTT